MTAGLAIIDRQSTGNAMPADRIIGVSWQVDEIAGDCREGGELLSCGCKCLSRV